MGQRSGWRAGAAAVAVAALVGLVLWQGRRAEEAPAGLTLRGPTMGTTYTVKTGAGPAVDPEALQARITERLAEINRSMSTWDPTSEISRLNAGRAVRGVPVSEDFQRVLAAALRLGKATGGAFDVTMGPLVNLWGFGPPEQGRFPTAAEVRAALARTGHGRVHLADGKVTLDVPGMYLDFSGIAKGYGVDAVAEVLRQAGFANYLVEIGGEVVAAGEPPEGGAWAVGVDRPEEGAVPGAGLEARILLRRGALATSGSYRRFLAEGATRRHHIIDPRTGAPTDSPLVSVTVHAPDCMTADAVATALMVMGTAEGLAWVAGRPDIEALFIERTAAGDFRERASAGFAALLE